MYGYVSEAWAGMGRYAQKVGSRAHGPGTRLERAHGPGTRLESTRAWYPAREHTGLVPGSRAHGPGTRLESTRAWYPAREHTGESCAVDSADWPGYLEAWHGFLCVLEAWHGFLCVLEAWHGFLCVLEAWHGFLCVLEAWHGFLCVELRRLAWVPRVWRCRVRQTAYWA